MVAKEKIQDLMAEYLEKQTIVIADASSVSRTRLKKCLLDLGAKAINIKSCSSYEEAEMEMEKANPRIVLSEYMIGKKSGFDLLRQYREAHEQSVKSLFILITASGDQSLVAKAAEEEIDSFVLKPYTANSLKRTLTKTAMDKLYPSKYAQKINEGKSLLFDGQYDESKQVFKEAIRLTDKPTLAYFYYGQAEAMQEALDSAKDKYEEGLSYNKIHYKCLVSLFDLLHEQEKYTEAYQIVRKLAKYFPANPQRLGTVLRLAIKTDNVLDIEEYYGLFKQIDDRPDFLIKNMSAGLVICGKYNMSKKKIEKGLLLFEQVAIISKGDRKFLLFIIEFLIYYGEVSEVPKFIRRFLPEDAKSNEFRASHFLQESATKTPLQIIQSAQQLIKDKIESIGIYYILIQNLTRQERFTEAATYCKAISQKWPEKSYFFDEIRNKYPQLTQDAS